MAKVRDLRIAFARAFLVVLQSHKLESDIRERQRLIAVGGAFLLSVNYGDLYRARAQYPPYPDIKRAR